MPYNDPQKSKEYYINNKEKIKERKKLYYENNKQKVIEHSAKYYEDNKEKQKEQKKNYNNTTQGKKVYAISRWKRRGVICDDYFSLYDKYINTNNCDECNIEFDNGRFRRCLDHNHETGLFRNVLCNTCNVKRK